MRRVVWTKPFSFLAEHPALLAIVSMFTGAALLGGWILLLNTLRHLMAS